MRRLHPAGDLDFALEALEEVGVVGVLFVEELQGDQLAGVAVARLPDGPHPAFADLFEEFEALSQGSDASPGWLYPQQAALPSARTPHVCHKPALREVNWWGRPAVMPDRIYCLPSRRRSHPPARRMCATSPP